MLLPSATAGATRDGVGSGPRTTPSGSGAARIGLTRPGTAVRGGRRVSPPLRGARGAMRQTRCSRREAAGRIVEPCRHLLFIRARAESYRRPRHVSCVGCENGSQTMYRRNRLFSRSRAGHVFVLLFYRGTGMITLSARSAHGHCVHLGLRCRWPWQGRVVGGRARARLCGRGPQAADAAGDGSVPVGAAGDDVGGAGSGGGEKGRGDGRSWACIMR